MIEPNQNDNLVRGVTPQEPGHETLSIGPYAVAPMPLPPQVPNIVPEGIGPDVVVAPLPPTPPQPKDD